MTQSDWQRVRHETALNYVWRNGFKESDGLEFKAGADFARAHTISEILESAEFKAIERELLSSETFCTWLCEDSNKYPSTDAGLAARGERRGIRKALEALALLRKKMGE